MVQYSFEVSDPLFSHIHAIHCTTWFNSEDSLDLGCSTIDWDAWRTGGTQ